MVDTQDLFRKLGAGAKFDFKRFSHDAEKFKMGNNVTTPAISKDVVEEALDFFGSRTKCKDKNLEGEVELTTSNVKKKRKKKRKVEKDDSEQVEDLGEISLLANDPSSTVAPKKAKKMTQEQIAEQHKEKINQFRRKHKIHVKGTDIPDPMDSFTELKSRFGISKTLIKNITNCGYEEPTPIQMQAVSIMMKHRELLACAPTGSGKTLAFILPILAHLKEPKAEGFRAVVVSPTRELAQQIYREFVRMNEGVGLRIHILTKAKSNSFSGSSSNKLDVLITTPNRLVHLLQHDPPAVQLSRVEWLVLDEGDKLFEATQDGFRDQVATIYQACDNPNIKRCLFSATLANNVEEWCKNHLDNVVGVTVGTRNAATNTIEQELMFVGQEAGKLLAMRQIIQQGFQPPVLVFVQSKDRARELFNELIYDGLNVDVIHADRTQAQRENVIKSFRSGKIWILIATELMGRGMDLKGVNLVVNYDFPPSAVSYIHRIGRTGRAGRKGKAITMFTEDDVVNLRSIANVMKASGCEIPEWMLQIKKPSRNAQKKLEVAPVKRASIKTVTKYDISKSKQRKQMIDDSKAKKT